MPAIARIGDAISHGGSIISGAGRTLVEGQPAARQGDSVSCAQHGMQTITGGSSIVIVEGKPVARLGDGVSCGATISSGAGTVQAG
ncbi:MAG: PAAR domain-containing protein [Armatimonadota bacterium]